MLHSRKKSKTLEYVVACISSFSPLYQNDLFTLARAEMKETPEQNLIKFANEEIRQKFSIEILTSFFKREIKIGKTLGEFCGDSILVPKQIIRTDLGPAIVYDDFIGSKTLSSFITETDASFRLLRFNQIGIRIVEVLSRIHKLNAVYRNISSCSILVDEELNVKFENFSSCSFYESESESYDYIYRWDSRLSDTRFISPEQSGRMNRKTDFRSDFYSLGVVLYEWLTGKLPILGKDKHEIIFKHMAFVPPHPSELDPAIPAAFGNLVMKLLQKNPEDRYFSCDGLLADFNSLKNGIDGFSVGMFDDKSRLVFPEKVYGRDKEIQQIRDAFGSALLGDSKIILVRGYTGVGKTTLIHEVIRNINSNNTFFVSGKFDQFKTDIPFASLIDAFNDLMRIILSSSDNVLNTWKEKLLIALDGFGQLLIDCFPSLEFVIGRQPQIPELAPEERIHKFYITFIKMIRVFCTEEHPLILIMDDLQWADSSSLHLVVDLFSKNTIPYLVVIGAYRHNEMGDSLMNAINLLKDSDGRFVEICLPNLIQQEFLNLLSDTLNIHPNSRRLMHLCQVMFNKSDGNPFFFLQLIRRLYEQDIIKFNFEIGEWEWDVSKLVEIKDAENVIYLMTQIIENLPKETQECLSIAACIGGKFCVSVISNISDENSETVCNWLKPALRANLIIKTQRSHKINTGEIQLCECLQGEVFTFNHDRIQQSAFQLIPQESRRQVHLKLARLMIRNREPDDLFLLTNHLNESLPLLITVDEKLEAASFNRQCFYKASLFGSVNVALCYSRICISIYDDELKNDHASYFESLCCAMEAEYLNKNIPETQIFIDLALEESQTTLEKVKILRFLITFKTGQGRISEAIEIGSSALALLGMNISINESDSSKREEFVSNLRRKLSLSLKEIRDLEKLERTDDPEKIAALDLIMLSLAAPIFIARTDLLTALVLKAVELSIQCPNSPAGCFSFCVWGSILCGFFNDFLAGYEFGHLAVRLVDKFDNHPIKIQVYKLFASRIQIWKEPIMSSMTNFQLAITNCSKGILNKEYQAYACAEKIMYMFLAGVPMDHLKSEGDSYFVLIPEIINQNGGFFLNMCFQMFHSLSNNDQQDPKEWKGPYFDDKILPKLETYSLLKFDYYLCKTIACVFFCKFRDAIEYCKEAEKTKQFAFGMLMVGQLYFYSAIAHLAIVNEGKIEYIDVIKDYLKRLEIYLPNSSFTFDNKVTLIKAGLAAIAGRQSEASELFMKSIAEARKSNFIHEVCLGYEMYAILCANNLSVEEYQFNLQEAYYASVIWGMKGKIQYMADIYSPLLKSNKMADDKDDELTDRSEFLDICDESNLLSRLLQMSMEVVGADHGVLVLEKNGLFEVENDAYLINGVIEEGTKKSDIPISMLSYVWRSKNLIINTYEPFENDKYYISSNPKSVLCVPLIHMSKCVACLYLENNVALSAFSRDSIKIVKMLSSQTAIAIVNSVLRKEIEIKNQELEESKRQLEQYNENLEEKISQRTLELIEKNSQLLEEIKERKRIENELFLAKQKAEQAAEAKTNFLANMSHEIRTPMNSIVGFSDLLIETSLDFHQKEFINNLRQSALDLLNIINDILDLTKVEAGKIELENVEFDVEDVIVAAIELISKSALEKGLFVNYLHDKNCGTKFFGDPTRFRQVVLNLLSNAVKFTPKGEIFVECKSIKGNLDNDVFELMVNVKDTGIGLNEEAITKLFQPFQQADQSTTRLFGGTGLGLYLSKTLAMLMGGDIKVTSEVGTGSNFTFTCILTRATFKEPESFLKNSKICLHIERDKSMRNIILEYLSDSIFTTMPPFDLIICESDCIPSNCCLDKSIIICDHGKIEKTDRHRGVFLYKPIRRKLLLAASDNILGRKVIEKITNTPILSVVNVSCRVLVAEDNHINQKLIMAMLQNLNLKPTIVENGQQVLDILESGQEFDVIFMDIQMPVMDGLSCTREIKKRFSKPPKIIAMTANAIQGDKEICLEAGMDDYMSKPIRFKALKELINEL